MSVSNKNSNKPLKVTILIMGALLIGAGLAPYINSYLLTPEVSNIEEPQQEIDYSIDNNSDNNEEIVGTQPVQPMTPEEVQKARQLRLETLKMIAESKNQVAPLPTLNESDEFVLQQLPSEETPSLFMSLDVIRKFVVFIDNFAQGELVSNFSPLQKPLTKFSVEKEDKRLTMNEESYHRYDKYANIIDSIDTDNFIYLYALLTPLIDEAYQEIGYPSGSFTSTFNTAINQILDTPVIRYKIELISPSVMYKYADESLENLPDTQKLMLRMGPENLQTIKIKLREIQNELQGL